MELHNVIPGSPEWLALRAQPNTYTASEAPAMMGASPYMTRSELLAQKHTGLVREVDAGTQRRFDDGHEAEAAYRPVAEEIIGDELYPCTGSVMVDGMRLLASFDGLTMDRKVGFEHKLFNMKIADAIASHNEPGPAYYWQLEQQLLVSGAEKIMFVTSAGTAENATTCWYESKPERRAALIAGWKQFAEDLKNYTAPAATPVVVAEPVQALPAVMVQVSGEIAVRENFKAFETALRDFLDHRLIREPKTDQDFADLEVQIKAMKGAEEALAGAEAQMLAQVQSIDQAKKTKDMLAKLVRDNRLMAEKLLTSEKERRRGEIVAGGVAAFKAHIDGLNQRLGKPYMPPIPSDFGGAIKGMRSLASMEDAVATTLAKAKIAANEAADRIQANLSYLAEDVPQGHAFLFADLPTIVLKATDDFRATVDSRIAAHKAKREKEEAETRERIRAEEERKAQAAVQADQDRLREEGAAAARQKILDDQAAAQKASTAPAVAATPTVAAVSAPAAFTPVAAAPIRVNPVPIAANDGAVINVGEINSRLAGGLLVAPLSVTAAGLQELGFAPVPRKGAGVFFRESDYPRMCEALIQHLTQVADLQVA